MTIAFDELDMAGIGCVDHDSARVWYRASQSGAHQLELADDLGHVLRHTFEVQRGPEDGTGSLEVGPASGTPLEPGSAYHWSLARLSDGSVLGHGELVTSPTSIEGAPDEFSIAVGSCHQPFGDDGKPLTTSIAMLEALEEVITPRHVVRMILLGDQMYADLPKPYSLFNPEYFASVAPPGRRTLFECTRAEVRQVYQARYRAFMGVPPFRRLQQATPTWMVPDDHEFVDNFGSLPKHATERWKAIREGALDACFDYEGLRCHPRTRQRPPSLCSTMVYGPVACFIMDLRSQKRADADRIQIYDDMQHLALRRFLRDHADKPILMLGLSVPLAYLPDWMANLGARLGGELKDAADRWNYKKATESRERLVKLLRDHGSRHPHQQLILLSGDVHAGIVSRIRWTPRERQVLQLVSSGLTNLEGRLYHRIAELLPRLGAASVVGSGVSRCEIALLDGSNGHTHNPYGHLNCGVITVRRTPRGHTVQLTLLGLAEVAPHPQVERVFESEPLLCA